MRTLNTWTLLLGVVGAWSGGQKAALALPQAPAAFCGVYPDSPSCQGGSPACTFCHTTPPARNAFGAQLSAVLASGAPRPLDATTFTSGLPEALSAVEPLDADADGATNLEEILGGSLPYDPNSRPVSGDCPSDEESLGWNPCAPDLRFSHRKMSLDFCGRSPTRQQRADFEAATDKEAFLAALLDRCVDTEHWRGRDGVVWRLAHRKIKPIQSIKSGEEAGDIPLADYLDDYSLFVYTQTDDRDARDLLLADYYVARTDGPTTIYERFDRSPLQDTVARGFNQAQLVEKDRRAGMVTMRWFLMSNTMFTGLPRTTAAQAYRAYLGYDISKLEGLFDVPGEPMDYDAKGVAEAECARCHATLDPLTYPFSRYSGIGGESSFSIPYSYVPDRPLRFTHVDGERMADTPEQGYIFGEPVQTLRDWATVAANSDAFAKATVLDYWRLLMGADPSPIQQIEFEGVWSRFKNEHAYRVEAMLHDLAKTEAYRVP